MKGPTRWRCLCGSERLTGQIAVGEVAQRVGAQQEQHVDGAGDRRGEHAGEGACRGGDRPLPYRQTPWVDWSNYWGTGGEDSLADGDSALTSRADMANDGGSSSEYD